MKSKAAMIAITPSVTPTARPMVAPWLKPFDWDDEEVAAAVGKAVDELLGNVVCASNAGPFVLLADTFVLVEVSVLRDREEVRAFVELVEDRVADACGVVLVGAPIMLIVVKGMPRLRVFTFGSS